MSTITDITSAASSASASSTGGSAADLGIDDFLTLLTTQLQNQDPLNPMDSTEFVAQLAQFGTVSGIQSMQDSLETLSSSLRSSQMLSGASLVGHEVTMQASSAKYSGSDINGSFEVPEGTSTVTLYVKDSSGQVVRQASVQATSGTQSFTWDGTDNDGVAVDAGTYTFEAIGTAGSTHESLSILLNAHVNSVSLGADGTSLTVNTSELGAVALSDVREII
jgi:flagellar basal-body rod modification protein FlgD